MLQWPEQLQMFSYKSKIGGARQSIEEVILTPSYEHYLWARTAANASVARTAANVSAIQKQDRRQSIAEVMFTPSRPRTQQLVCFGREQLVASRGPVQCAPACCTVQYELVLMYAVWHSAVSFFSTKEQVSDE